MKNNSKLISFGKSISRKANNEETSVTKGSARLSLIWAIFFLAGTILVSGGFYLYQVNDLATKGYEIKNLESEINELERESKKMQIREVELKSMYNIEKATEELQLINSTNISYLEINGPVAMK